MRAFIASALFACVLQFDAATHAPAKADRGGAAPQPSTPDKPRLDRFGDPLPVGALARLGTLRHRFLDLFRNYAVYAPRTEFLRDGRTALTDTPVEVRWVDQISGRLLKSWPLPDNLTVAGFSPDGLLAALTDRKSVQLWDITHTKPLRKLETPDKRYNWIHARFGDDGTVVAINCGADLLQVLDTASGKQLWKIAAGDGTAAPEVLGFLPDRKRVFLLENLTYDGASPYRAAVRDRMTGRLLRSFDTVSPLAGGRRVLSPDGKTLFQKGAQDIRAWNIDTGKELPSLYEKTRMSIPIAVSPDGKTVLTGATPQNRYVTIWDWPSARRRGKINCGLGAGNLVADLRIRPDGRSVAIITLGETAPRFYDLISGKELPSPRAAHRAMVSDLAIAPDGTVVTGAGDDSIRVWDQRSGTQLHEYATGFPVGIMSLTLSPDGRLIATADFNSGKVFVRKRDTGRIVDIIDTRGKNVRSVAFAPHESLLAISGQGFLVLWDLSHAREKWRLNSTWKLPVFRPDGRVLAVADEGRIRLLDSATGKERFSIPQANVREITFSPDGRMLAAWVGRAVAIWELASGKERWRGEPVLDFLQGLAFSPDGRWLAASGGRSILLHDVLAGRRVHSWAGHETGITKLAFARDGNVLASASWDTTVLIWDMAPWLATRPRSVPPDETTLQGAWNKLADADAKTAFAAVRVLVEAGVAALPLLRRRLLPVAAPDPRHVQDLLSALGSNRFVERDRARQALEGLAELAEPALKDLLARTTLPLETSRRAERVLTRVQGPTTDPGKLQQLRGLEALERLALPECRPILEALATGAATSRLTQQAGEALQRFGKKKK